MKRLLGAVVTVVVAAMTGCGGDDDDGGGGTAPALIGMYTIDHHTESTAVAGGAPATCNAEGAALTTPPFLGLVDDSIGEITRLGWGLCDTSDASSCSSELDSFEDIDAVWQIGAATSASYSGGGCSLYHTEGSITLVSEAPRRVRLEVKEWYQYLTEPQDACTVEAAAALAGQPDCAEHVVIEATAVE